MERLKSACLRYAEPVDTKHIDVLDGVRALSVLMVCWFHIWQLSWYAPSFDVLGVEIVLLPYLRAGYMGVDLLLLLSGFLLYLPLTQSDKKLDVWAFCKKRLVRVAPSYVLCIAIMLIFVALPERRYASVGDMLRDLAAHLTFTQNLFPDSYLRSPLNGVLWTLAVEMQFYLIFPLLAAAFRKRPLIAYLGMTALAFGFRAFASAQEDTTLYVNQLPAFLDVYANGFAAAVAFASLRKKFSRQDARTKIYFTVAAIAALALLLSMMREQAALSDYEAIRRGQMARRYGFSAVAAMGMVSLCFSLPIVRFLFGNRLMRFLAAVSYQMYIWHQVFAARLIKWGFPPSEAETPNVVYEQPWQTYFTLCAFLGALVIAASVTYCFERPILRASRGKKT